MVSIERLSIDIGFDLSGLGQLERAANALRELWASQKLVDEHMTIDIDVDGHSEVSAMAAELAALRGASVGAGDLGDIDVSGLVPDGGDGGEGGDGLFENLRDFNLRMSDIHNLLANIVPLLGVFVGAIPAAYTGLFTLGAAALGAAGALAGIAGFGALGVAMEDGRFQLENLTDILERIQQSFLEAFSPLAERLAPTFLSAVDGLERFFDELAARGAVLLEFRDEALAFGGFLLDVVPRLIAELGRLASVVSPIFTAIGNFIENENLVRNLAAMFADILPSLAVAATAIRKLLPGLVKASTGFLIVAAAILTVFQQLTALLDVIPGGAVMFGALAATVLTLATMFSLATTVIGMVGSALTTLGPIVASAITWLEGLTIAEIQAAIATATLTEALLALAAVTGIGLLVAGVGLAAAEFSRMNANIRDATKSLKDFGRTQRSLSSMSMGFGSAAPTGSPTYVDVTDNSTTKISAGSVEEGKRIGRSVDWNEGASKAAIVLGE